MDNTPMDFPELSLAELWLAEVARLKQMAESWTRASADAGIVIPDDPETQKEIRKYPRLHALAAALYEDAEVRAFSPHWSHYYVVDLWSADAVRQNDQPYVEFRLAEDDGYEVRVNVRRDHQSLYSSYRVDTLKYAQCNNVTEAAATVRQFLFIL